MSDRYSAVARPSVARDATAWRDERDRTERPRPGHLSVVGDDARGAHPGHLGEYDYDFETPIGGVPPALSVEPFTPSETALAERFAIRYQDRLRYVAQLGKWFQFDGKRWRIDNTLAAFDLAKDICVEASHARPDPKAKAALESAKTRWAVVSLARADRRIAATIDQWDADPWLLNTPEGVVDLRTGEMREHNPLDYMSKSTSVSPNGDCPIFLNFLRRVMGDDEEKVKYLQTVFGYALTGVTREHAVFFAYGDGGNGKSVLFSTIAGIMGDYHRSAPMATFTDSGRDRHLADVASLLGARMVTASETERGRPWAEARVKEITGGGKISAQFMRQDYFRVWWMQTVAELRHTNTSSAPLSASVLAAALVEGALTFIVKHARERGQFQSKDYEKDPRTWKVDDLVASAASGGAFRCSRSASQGSR